jgi:hypothetical protein
LKTIDGSAVWHSFGLYAENLLSPAHSPKFGFRIS